MRDNTGYPTTASTIFTYLIYFSLASTLQHGRINMRYVGIYKFSDETVGDQGFIFDISMTQHPYRDYDWDLVAVLQLPAGASLTTDRHRPDTIDRIHGDSGAFGPLDVLNGRLGPVIVWTKPDTHQISDPAQPQPHPTTPSSD